jgi:hypothetical protein
MSRTRIVAPPQAARSPSAAPAGASPAHAPSAPMAALFPERGHRLVGLPAHSLLPTAPRAAPLPERGHRLLDVPAPGPSGRQGAAVIQAKAFVGPAPAPSRDTVNVARQRRLLQKQGQVLRLHQALRPRSPSMPRPSLRRNTVNVARQRRLARNQRQLEHLNHRVTAKNFSSLARQIARAERRQRWSDRTSRARAKIAARRTPPTA